MGWFRRSRSAPAAETADSPVAEAAEDRHLPVPVASAPALARTERALRMLAAQSAQMHGSLVQLEHRVDALAAALLEEMERPSYDDVLAARAHSARTAAELARLEVNIAARLEAVRADLAELRGHGAGEESGRRSLRPTDTGWHLRAG